MARIFQIIQNPWLDWKFHYCGKNFWQIMFFARRHVCVEKNIIILSGKNLACLPFPKRIRLLIKSLLKNSFSTNLQGTGPWEGPVHLSRFVFKVRNSSKLFRRWSWSQKKKDTPLTKATFAFSFSGAKSKRNQHAEPHSLQVLYIQVLQVPYTSTTSTTSTTSSPAKNQF